MGLGELFSLACAVVWALAVILFTRIGTRLPAFELNFVKNIIGCVLLVITTLIIEGSHTPDLSLQQWLIVLTSGVIGIAVADTFYMKALNTIGAASTGIVAALYSPFVVVLSMLMLNESLNIFQWFGLSLVLSGILMISREKSINPISDKQKWLGFVYGALSVFLTALGVVMVKPVLEQQPFFWSTSVRLLAGVVGMILYLIVTGNSRKSWSYFKQPQPWFSIILASVLGAYLAMILWLAGFKYTDASIAAILNETTSIFIIFLAWLILKESISKKKIGGALLAVSGVVMVLVAGG